MILQLKEMIHLYVKEEQHHQIEEDIKQDRMNRVMKEKVLSYFNKLKKKKITIINFASDVRETIGSDYTILVDKKLVFNKKTKEVTKDNKLFEDNHLKLPFLLDITNKLKYYGLVEKDVKDMESLVDELWK